MHCNINNRKDAQIMLKKLYAVLMTLFLTAAILPQPVLAEEEPAETTEETVTEAEEVTEEVPEEVIAEEEEEPEEAVIVEEEPAEEEVTPVEEPEEEIEEPAEEPEEVIVPEETELEEEVISEEEPAEEIKPEEEIEEPAEEPEEIIVPEETEPEEEVIPEEEPAEEAVEEPEEVAVPEEAPAEEEPVVIEEEVEEKAEIADATEYKLTYNPNGGTFESYYEVDANGNYVEETYDGEIYVSYIGPTRKNYRFDGWYTNKNGTGEEQTYNYLTLTKNTTLYAKWIRVYTVTFNANGGKMYGSETTEKHEVDSGESVYVGNASYYDLTRAGYAFDGWYTSKNYLDSERVETWSYYTPSKNTTLYAKWAAAYKIVFDANGGKFYSGETTQTEYVKKGSYLDTISYNTPEKSGYIFRGWGLSAKATETINYYDYVPAKNTKLYAVYVPEVTVKLNANGGKFDDSKTVRNKIFGKGDHFSIYDSDKPTKSGYVFYAWYTSKTFTEANKVTDNTVIKKNMTVYARFVKYYTVTFTVIGDGKYGTLSGYSNGTYVSGKKKIVIQVPQGMPVRSAVNGYAYNSPADGYAFGGYYLDSKCTAANKLDSYYDYIPRANTTIYAKFVKEVKVTFNGNGGTSLIGDYNQEKVKTVSYTRTAGQPIGTQPTFTNGKKIFEGWYLDKALTKKINYPFGYAPTKNTTFYAKWITPVTITFNANGGKFSDDKAKKTFSGIKGQELRQNVDYPTRSGYSFAGWYTDSTLKTAVYDPYHYEVKKAATLYAKWVKNVTITFNAGKGVLFNEKGAEVKTRKIGYAKGYSPLSNPAGYWTGHWYTGAGGDGGGYWYPVPWYEGYEFAGWYTDSKLTKEFDPNTVLTKNITLYAKYVKYNSGISWITITIDANGGTITNDHSNKFEIIKNSILYSNSYRSYIAAPKGKAFVGFTTTKNDPKTLVDVTNKVFTKNSTVYAYYDTEYTVVLDANGGFANSGSYYDGYVYSVFNLQVVKVRKGNTVGIIDYYYDNPYFDHMLTNASGKIFRGWYSDKACTKLVTYDLYSYKPTKNITLYAKWGKPNAAGWKKTNGKWWYKLTNGDYYKNGFQVIGNKMYYFNASGYILTGWQKLDNSWFYFESSGAMVTGWKKISGKWYYFEGSGVMLTGWQKLSGKWYYFESSGAMVTGWKKIGGKWYYFESGGAMKTGWLKSGGNWYYFNSSGVMVTGTVTIGSKSYTFNSSGVCQNP